VSNSPLYNTVSAWAEIVIIEWLKKARILNIHDGHLLNSFASHVITNSDGDPTKILLLFEYYGNFVDWGVGRGVSVANKEIMINAGNSKRREKPFISDVIYKQIAVLRHLMEEKYAMKVENFIIKNTEVSNNNNSLKFLENRI